MISPMEDGRRRVAVIGAGMTGLVAALRLGRSGVECDVYERWPGLGGQVATLDVGDGHLLERYYHHLFTSDVHIAALYEELEMSDPIEWIPSSVAMFAEGASHPFNSPLDLLRFKPLSLPARLRMGFSVLRLQRGGGAQEDFESETARAWIERTMGHEPWEKVWGPMMRGKFGNRADEISMAWLWKRLTVRRQAKGRQARGEVLGYPRGGWQPLLERLRDEIDAGGGRVLIDRPATQLAQEVDGFRVSWGAVDSFRRGHDPRQFEVAGEDHYDAVIATVPNDVFEQLLEPETRSAIGDEYLDRLQSIEYHSALCVLLELDRKFSDFYWTNIAEPEIPFVGLIEQTNFIAAERYGGRHFLYVANYLERGHPLLGFGFDELLDHYTAGLRRVNPAFSPDWVRRFWVFQEPAAQPVVTVGYHERIPPLATGVPGLFLANTTQVYPEDRGTNYGVRLGNQAAEALMQAMATGPVVRTT
jgi:protoporphyrinogen oxidase